MDDLLAAKLRDLPGKPGCYRFIGESGRVLYVGKATNLRSRVRSYFAPSGPRGRSLWIERMVPLVRDIDVMVTSTPVEALLLETTLIKQHRPPFNARLTDDKHFPYICLTWQEEYPRLTVVRRVQEDGNQYFGPYSNSRAMRQTLDLVRRLFGICVCKPSSRRSPEQGPCLQYHMGYCAGACAGLIPPEDYRENLRQAARFLRGHTEDVAREFQAKMQRASEALEFEKAAEYRDKLRAIEETVQKQAAISTDLADFDALGIAPASEEGETATVALLFVRAGRLTDHQDFTLRHAYGREPSELLGEFLVQYYERAAFIPRQILTECEPEDQPLLEQWLSQKKGSKVVLSVPQRGEKRRLVEMAKENARAAARQTAEAERMATERGQGRIQALAKDLGLQRPPQRIECYDISTLQGNESVGSMVVFQGGLPARDQYRSFRIRCEDGKPNDYAMMREVLARRFLRLTQREEEGFASDPDLVVVDGGKGQLGCALAVMEELGLSFPVVSLAKRLEEVYVPDVETALVLPPRSEGLYLLMSLRDEAHRFAVTHHRKRRSKATTRSILDDIPGIGPKRKRALLEKFPSVRALCEATVDEVAAVPGMNTKLAGDLLRRLKTPGTGPGRREDRAPIPSGEWIDEES